jgi:hypothetical protein
MSLRKYFPFFPSILFIYFSFFWHLENNFLRVQGLTFQNRSGYSIKKNVNLKMIYANFVERIITHTCS